MTMLTPQDVRSVQFEKNLRGYRTEDVDRFLDKVEEQLQQNDAQAEQLRKQIADLTAENQKLKVARCKTQKSDRFPLINHTSNLKIEIYGKVYRIGTRLT